MKQYDLLIIIQFPKNDIGMQNKLERLIYFSKKFNCFIFTNEQKINGLINQQIIQKRTGFSSSIIFFRKVKYYIENLRYKVLFLIGNELSYLTLLTNKPTCIYGNTSPFQPGFPSINNLKTLLFDLYRTFKMVLFFPGNILGLKKAKKIFVISPMMKELYSKIGVYKDNISIYELGVNLKRFELKKESTKQINNHFKILSLGTLSFDRGITIIEKVTEKIRKLNLKISVHHIGNIQKEYLFMNKKENYLKYLNHISPIPFRKLINKMKTFDVGLSLLRSDTYYEYSPPQKIFEFMASGMPIIANKIPTHELYIKHNYNGLLINWCENELLNAILHLYNNSNLYKKLQKNCLNYVKNYNIVQILKKNEKELRTILKFS